MYVYGAATVSFSGCRTLHVFLQHCVLDLDWEIPRIDNIFLVNTTVPILFEELVHVGDLSPDWTSRIFDHLTALPLVRALDAVYSTPYVAPLVPRDTRASTDKVRADRELYERLDVLACIFVNIVDHLVRWSSYQCRRWALQMVVLYARPLASTPCIRRPALSPVDQPHLCTVCNYPHSSPRSIDLSLPTNQGNLP